MMYNDHVGLFIEHMHNPKEWVCRPTFELFCIHVCLRSVALQASRLRCQLSRLVGAASCSSTLRPSWHCR
jgi:hypothetical protein